MRECPALNLYNDRLQNPMDAQGSKGLSTVLENVGRRTPRCREFPLASIATWPEPPWGDSVRSQGNVKIPGQAVRKSLNI